jgi:pimeloyl-ACP methyl ester carboxylesterase
LANYSEHTFTNPDGLKQYYRDFNTAGEGAPTVLCMPGLSRNSKDFEGIATHMAESCRVICVEQRGRGNSEWDPDPTRYRPDVYVADMMALLEHLGLKQVIAYGVSLGGLMTIMIGAMHPSTLKAAIINDIGPEVDPKGIARIKGYVGKGSPPESWDQAIVAVKAANAGVYPKFSDAEWEWFTRKLYDEKDGKLVVQYDPAISQNFESDDSQSAPDLWPVFDMLKDIPLVVLRGGLSDILSAETLEKMAARHPDLVPVTVPDKGHVPLMTEPECLAAVDALLKKIN